MRRRARSDEQKEVRRRAILEAAVALFEETSYGEVTMAAVAERAALAKGTVYLYFRTKEELFLAILGEQFAHWFDAVDERLASESATWSAASVARALAESLAPLPALVRLIAIMQSVLEQNIDLATAVAFKRMLAERTLATGALLERRLPFLGPGGGAALLLRVHALVVGLQPMADPAPVSREAMREPGLEIFEVELIGALEETLRYVMLGIEREQGDKQ
jgi:AcrR family transcriptional regulator